MQLRDLKPIQKEVPPSGRFIPLGGCGFVLNEDSYSFATCRFYELDGNSVLIGRVVIISEYSGRDFCYTCIIADIRPRGKAE